MLIALILAAAPSRAQDNYEIQVYGSDLVETGYTMVELHSNFTIGGTKTVEDGLYPTQHQLHETIESAHGLSDWFESGFYKFYFSEEWLTATDFSGYRPECSSELGNQFRIGSAVNAIDAPPDHQDDSGLPLRFLAGNSRSFPIETMKRAWAS